MKIPILKQTRHLIIINKPALVYSQHNSSQSSQSSLSSQQELPLLNLLRESSPDLFPKSVQAPFTWPKLVHRLDYGVSGAMVVATSMQAARNFSKNLKEGGMKGWPLRKTYIALVHAQRSSILDHLFAPSLPPLPHYLTITSQSPLSGIITAQISTSTSSISATTNFTILSRVNQNEFLISLEPVTGRKHQLRRHCAYVLDAPVVGDTAYGYTGGKGSGSRQIALHSWKLEYKTGLHFESVIAPILQGIEKDGVWSGGIVNTDGILVLPSTPYGT
ncbi:pseudouridine synthase [Kockiozyma suomiensis]|uniref:pseudouridine synthase n=1 Tax=Kockiozyma suomiensis TaxID=1337062 RepID=UPI003343EFD3